MPCVFEEHYYTLHEESDRYDDEFRRICAFDIVINNTDRKAGHCVLGVDDKIWAIDHGVAFHQEFKLRTVLGTSLARTFRRGALTSGASLTSSGTVRGPAESFERDAVTTRTTTPALQRFPEMRPGDVAFLAVGLTFRRRCGLGSLNFPRVPLTQKSPARCKTRHRKTICVLVRSRRLLGIPSGRFAVFGPLCAGPTHTCVSDEPPAEAGV